MVHTRFEDSGLRSYQQTHQWLRGTSFCIKASGLSSDFVCRGMQPKSAISFFFSKMLSPSSHR